MKQKLDVELVQIVVMIGAIVLLIILGLLQRWICS